MANSGFGKRGVVAEARPAPQFRQLTEPMPKEPGMMSLGFQAMFGDWKNILRITGISLLLLALAVAVLTRQSDTSASSSARLSDGRMTASQESTWIVRNQSMLRQKLRDPGSAQFGRSAVSYASGAPVVCGTVNASNAFGGYTGSERWVGMGNTVGVYLESEVDGFNDLWRRVC